MATLYTIGHSTREADELLAALQAHGIRSLYDIRAFPASRRLPHFNREPLQRFLEENGIAYHWEPDMGGRRGKSTSASPNTALRSPAFRNYADYMLTEKFRAAAQRLLLEAEKSPTAYMCAEKLYFRCHRMLVSDYYAAHGNTVLHIEDTHPPRPHRLTPEARIYEGKLLYDGCPLFGTD